MRASNAHSAFLGWNVTYIAKLQPLVMDTGLALLKGLAYVRQGLRVQIAKMLHVTLVFLELTAQLSVNAMHLAQVKVDVGVREIACVKNRLLTLSAPAARETPMVGIVTMHVTMLRLVLAEDDAWEEQGLEFQQVTEVEMDSATSTPPEAEAIACTKL